MAKAVRAAEATDSSSVMYLRRCVLHPRGAHFLLYQLASEFLVVDRGAADVVAEADTAPRCRGVRQRRALGCRVCMRAAPAACTWCQHVKTPVRPAWVDFGVFGQAMWPPLSARVRVAACSVQSPCQWISACSLPKEGPSCWHLLTRVAARGAQFACQPSLSQCAVCHPLEKLRCLACSPPFAVNADGLCGMAKLPSPRTGSMRPAQGSALQSVQYIWPEEGGLLVPSSHTWKQSHACNCMQCLLSCPGLVS